MQFAGRRRLDSNRLEFQEILLRDIESGKRIMVLWNKSPFESDPPPVAEYAAVCRGVTKEYVSGETRVRAVQGIDLEVPFGELLLLVGQSGCGKTTLISIIAGLLDPTDGDVELLGRNRQQLWGRRLVQFRAQNIGFVFQQYNLLPALTAAENVAVPLLIRGQRRAEALPRAAAVLESVLQVNIRPGEALTATSETSLLILGDLSSKHVRVDIDEHDIPRFHSDAPAVGLVRGDTRHEFALQFVKLESLVIPKRSLTGDATERVDTRVLQAIYEIVETAEHNDVFVGQQMDVFIRVNDE
jgi:ABC-type oligopeptide transport system ATPase subunit